METGRNRTETVRFPKRIGMIVPSSNTVVEPICSRIFFRYGGCSYRSLFQTGGRKCFSG